MQRARKERADSRAHRHAGEDDAVDRRLSGPAEEARAQAGDQRTARALADAEQQHVRGEQRVAGPERHREQDRDAEECAGEADRRRAPVAETVGQPAGARDTEHRERAGDAERARRLERREADIDEIDDRLDDDQVHADGGEEHHLHEQPEGALAERGAHRADVGVRARRRCSARRQPGADLRPRHRRRDRQEREQRGADRLVGGAPAVRVDQRLRERDEQQRAAAEARVREADRGAHAALEPAADQRRCRHHADRGDAEPTEHADAKRELPERVDLAGKEVADAEQGEAARVEHARPPALEHHAAERRSEAADDHQRRVDRRHLRAVPAELLLERQQEDHVGVADAAADEVEREAQREHAGGHRSRRPPRLGTDHAVPEHGRTVLGHEHGVRLGVRRGLRHEYFAVRKAGSSRRLHERHNHPPMGPLHGIKVIDMTSVLMGPFASQSLGDMGADVVKVEAPQGDLVRQIGPARHPEMGPIFLNTNRNKRSIAIDLKKPAGLRGRAPPARRRRRAGLQRAAERDGASRPRLRERRRAQPAPRLRRPVRLRPGRPVRGAPRVRRPDPGRRDAAAPDLGREQGTAALRAVRHGRPDRRPDRRRRHPRRAARAPADRARAACRRADVRDHGRLRPRRSPRRPHLRAAARPRRLPAPALARAPAVPDERRLHLRPGLQRQAVARLPARDRPGVAAARGRALRDLRQPLAPHRLRLRRAGAASSSSAARPNGWLCSRRPTCR